MTGAALIPTIDKTAAVGFSRLYDASKAWAEWLLAGAQQVRLGKADANSISPWKGSLCLGRGGEGLGPGLRSTGETEEGGTA
jgi:hypothetical protein